MDRGEFSLEIWGFALCEIDNLEFVLFRLEFKLVILVGEIGEYFLLELRVLRGGKSTGSEVS